MPKVTQPGPEPRVTVPSPRAGPPCPRASRGKSHRTPVTTLRPAEAVCSGWATASLSQSRTRQRSLWPRPCGLRSPVSLRGCHLCRRRGRSRDAQGLARPFQVSAGFLLTLLLTRRKCHFSLGCEASPDGRTGSGRSPLPHVGVPAAGQERGLQRGGSSWGAFQNSGWDPVAKFMLWVETGLFFLSQDKREEEKNQCVSTMLAVAFRDLCPLYFPGDPRSESCKATERHGKGCRPLPWSRCRPSPRGGAQLLSICRNVMSTCILVTPDLTDRPRPVLWVRDREGGDSLLLHQPCDPREGTSPP